jgi:transposase
VDYNKPRLKLLRRTFAYHLIELLHEGFRIINVDETAFKQLDYRRRGWSEPQQASTVALRPAVDRLTVVAAIDNQGASYLSISQANSDSKSTRAILCDLVEILDEEDPSWRKKTILMLDNAAWHKAKQVRDTIEELHIPVLFCSPFSPQLSPVELFFSQLKSSSFDWEQRQKDNK